MIRSLRSMILTVPIISSTSALSAVIYHLPAYIHMVACVFSSLLLRSLPLYQIIVNQAAD
jgi:hypothetical protein